MAKKITFTNMIPCGDAYYPTNDLTAEERETAQSYTDKPVMADKIAPDNLTAWAKGASERVSVALSKYYGGKLDEWSDCCER